MVEKHAGRIVAEIAWKEQRVLLGDAPVFSDGVFQDEPDGIEDSRPEVLERAVGEEHRDPDQVHHEQRDPLQIHDENLARQRRHREKQRTAEKDMYDYNREERLQVPPKVVWADTSVVRPGG